jgi:non-homologous end joining protein Ku
MARALWRGAISFGLIYLPVEVHTASRENPLPLHMLDSRDFSPVGYQRINKRTGKEVRGGLLIRTDAWRGRARHGSQRSTPAPACRTYCSSQ